MNGGALTRSESLSMGPWLDRLRAPQPKANADAEAISRGQTVFPDSDADGSLGNPQHGNTATLSATQLTDLIAFLESL